MTKGFILCDKGFEKTVFEDTQRLLDKKLKGTFVERGFFFETENLTDFITLTYKSQSALRIIIPLVQTKRTNNLEGDYEQIVDFVTSNLTIKSVQEWVDETHTFKVAVSDILKKYDSQKLAQKLGAYIFTQAHAKADMKYPTTKLLLLATETDIMFGIDFSHTLLSKREYKMFNTPTALRSTIAYNLLCESGAIAEIADLQKSDSEDFDDSSDEADDEYQNEEEADEADEVPETLTILDPFCGSGTIPIEAALFVKNHSPRHFQNEELGFWKFKPFTHKQIEKHLATIMGERETPIPIKVLGYDIQTKAVDSTKKNAKIAGVNKSIKLSRVDIDWVDTKFEDGVEVDYIVTVPPYFTQHHPISKIQKPYVQFFDRIGHVLAEEGVIVFLTNKGDAVLEVLPKTFKLDEKKVIYMGKNAYDLLKIVRA